MGNLSRLDTLSAAAAGNTKVCFPDLLAIVSKALR